MAADGGAPQAETRPPVADSAPPSPRHIAAMREQEGFGGGPPENGTVQEAGDLADPPSPAKAMEVIRQQAQEKNQLQSELDAALNKIARYEAAYGEVD